MPIPYPPAHNNNVLFAKQLCDLLNSLEVAIPGCGRAIACLLTWTTIKGKTKKMGSQIDILKEKSLRCKNKNKKSGVLEKSVCAYLMDDLRSLGPSSQFGLSYGL
jgi:hypothetical protein